MKKAIVFVLAVGALTSTVFAQEVKITGKKCPLTVVTDRAAYENPEATAEGVESNAEAAEGSAEGAEAPKEVSKRVKLKNLDILGIVDDAYASGESDRAFLHGGWNRWFLWQRDCRRRL